MLLFAAGFALSLIGSLPPGLISLSVAQTAIAKGVVAAMLLAAGAAGAEFFQAWAAVELADWFMSHPAAEQWFRWVALPVFLGLGLYFIFWARPPRTHGQVADVSPLKQIGKGVLLSAFNLLAVPYWFAYCSSLRASGWWNDDNLASTMIFSAGVTTGTLSALGLYAWLGLMIVRRSESVARYANRVVGVIFLAIGIKILAGLLQT